MPIVYTHQSRRWGYNRKKQKSLFPWSLYSSTVRRKQTINKTNKKWNIERAINAIKKKEGRIESGYDVAIKIVWSANAWHLSKDRKDRGTNHVGVWGRLFQTERTANTKTLSQEQRRNHRWIESWEQGRTYSEHVVRYVPRSLWPDSPLQGLELHCDMGRWLTKGDTWPILCFSRITLAAVLRMDYRGAWVEIRPHRKLLQWSMGETVVAGPKVMRVEGREAGKLWLYFEICSQTGCVWGVWEKKGGMEKGIKGEYEIFLLSNWTDGLPVIWM